MRVEDVYNSKSQKTVHWVLPEASVSDAIRMMAEHKVGSLVVSRDGKKIRGLLSAIEIIHSIAELGMGRCCRKAA